MSPESSSTGLTVWDNRFMGLAVNARSWTKGLGNGIDRGVGACVVSPSRNQFSLGYAGFPRGIEDTCERLESKEYRDLHTVHAELNAILNARCDLSGWTMYSTECPCAQCANAIIQAGIKRVVSPSWTKNSSWASSQSEGFKTLLEADVNITRIKVRT